MSKKTLNKKIEIENKLTDDLIKQAIIREVPEILDNKTAIGIHSIGLVASLLSLGFEIDRVIENGDKDSIKFVFKRKGFIDYQIEQYQNEQLLVPAKSFLGSIRMIDAIIRNIDSF
jgi:hypothetical protein